MESRNPNDDNIRDLITKASQSGLAALARSNPMILYTAARYRAPTHELDRVYGIMQIFQLRLGHAAPGATTTDPTTPLTLSKLETELGMELLRRYPIMSQLHVIAESPPRPFATEPSEPHHQAWHVQATSVAPRLLSRIPHPFHNYYTTRSGLRLGVRALDGGATWAHFAGKVCAFEALQEAWADVEDERSLAVVPGAGKSSSIQELALDRARFYRAGVDGMEDPPYDVPATEGRQRRFGLGAMRMYGEQGVSLLVLWLGEYLSASKVTDPYGSPYGRIVDRVMIGLLLVWKEEEGVWLRQGICIWDVSDVESDLDDCILKGSSEDCKFEEGLFG